ncbi:TPA: hypothetical protein ACH3X1_014772 [Trebouxia sp. C0004]
MPASQNVQYRQPAFIFQHVSTWDWSAHHFDVKVACLVLQKPMSKTQNKLKHERISSAVVAGRPYLRQSAGELSLYTILGEHVPTLAVKKQQQHTSELTLQEKDTRLPHTKGRAAILDDHVGPRSRTTCCILQAGRCCQWVSLLLTRVLTGLVCT